MSSQHKSTLSSKANTTPTHSQNTRAKSNKKSEPAQNMDNHQDKNECRKLIQEEMRKVLREEMREIIKEEWTVMRKQFQADMEQSLLPIIEGLQRRIHDLEVHVRDRDNSVERFQRHALEVMSRVDPMLEAVDNLEAEVRRPVLILSGGAVPPPVEQKDAAGNTIPEDPAPVAVAFVNKVLPEVQLKRDDIATCFRVGNTKKLVVRFHCHGPNTPREKLYQGRFQLIKRRGVPNDQQLWINESLSPIRQNFMTALLEAKKGGRIHSVFTRNGQVFFRPSANAGTIRVDDPAKMDGYVSPRR